MPELMPSSPSFESSVMTHGNDESYLISPTIDTRPRFSPLLRLGVMASGNGTNFEVLAKACINKTIDAEIGLLIVNNQECNALKKAKELGINSLVIDHRDFKSRERLDQNLVSTFNLYKIEGIVMAGWMRIVTNVLIENFKGRLINIHPSLLPSFPGINAIQQALKANVSITGCTIHFVELQVDSGPIIMQAALPIENNDDEISLRNKIRNLEHKILPDAVLLAGKRWRNNYFNYG